MLRNFTLLILVGFIAACPDDPYCMVCANNSDACGVCQYSFLDGKTNKCSPMDTVSNCLSYSDKDGHACVGCDFGYSLTRSNTCKKCPEGCAACSDDVCDVCFNGVLPEKNQCKPNNIKCPVNNCGFCSYSIPCLVCKEGYAFNVALDCVNNSGHCLVELDDNTCLACKVGYYITSDHKCASIPHGSKSKYGLIIFIILVLGIVIGGVIYFVIKRKREAEASSNTDLMTRMNI